MGLFDKIKGVFSTKQPEEGEQDYLKIAADFEAQGNFPEAIREYQKLITNIYSGKESYKYRHIVKKIIDLYLKIGDYEQVQSLWPNQYMPEEYTYKPRYDLAILLEKAGKIDMAMKIYDANELGLQKQKVEFLIRLKKIDEANKECTRLLMAYKSNDKGIEDVWFLKARILMSIRRWEEAENYLIKVLEKKPHDLEARKLKDFCARYTRT